MDGIWIWGDSPATKLPYNSTSFSLNRCSRKFSIKFTTFEEVQFYYNNKPFKPLYPYGFPSTRLWGVKICKQNPCRPISYQDSVAQFVTFYFLKSPIHQTQIRWFKQDSSLSVIFQESGSGFGNLQFFSRISLLK